MPGYDDYAQKVPYPKLSDSPNIESALAALVNAAVPLGNLVYANANERAAALPNPVAGMESYLVAEGRKEYYNGSTWVPITPGQWQPLSFETGYVANTGSPSYRIVNGTVQLRGTVAKQTGAFAKGTFITIMTLPVGARPSAYRYFVGCTEFAADVYGRIEVQPDGVVRILIPNSAGTAASWISLDQVTYSLT